MSKKEKQEQINFLMGKMFYEMRIDKNVTQERIGENIITQKAISKFEQNGEIPNRLILNVLIQRLGKTMDYFTTLLSKQEYEYFVWRREVLRQIQEHTITDSIWQEKMANNRSLNENLQEQFVVFWRSYIKNDVEKMKQAVALTVDISTGLLNPKSCISSTEIAYLLLYFEKKAELFNILDARFLKSILIYIDENYEEMEKAKVFGKAVCLYGAYGFDVDPNEKIVYYRKALKLQRKLGRLDGIEDLLRGLLEQYKQTGQAPEEDYISMLSALTSIKEEFKIVEKSFLVQEVNSEFILLHEVLKYYRKERQLSVRQIDKKACSEKTYRALENGKRGANHSTYDLLVEVMDIQISRYSADIVSDKYSDYKLAAEIINARQSQDRHKSMKLLKKLEKSLGTYANLSINQQFIWRLRNVEDYFQKKITSEEFIERIDRTIQLTIPEWTPDYGTHFYTKGEVILIYHKALAYREMGRTDEALELIEKLWRFYEESEVDLCFHMEEVILIMLFWKNLLTDKGEYEDALDKTIQGIKMCFESGRGDKINKLVFELGWNRAKRLPLDKEKIKCTQYFKYALYMSKLFMRNIDEEVIVDYCKNNDYVI